MQQGMLKCVGLSIYDEDGGERCKLRINVADCTAGHDKCVRKNPVGSPGQSPVWQEVKEVKIGGPSAELCKENQDQNNRVCWS